MTDGYDCYQNALAERVNNILKGELLMQRAANLQQARALVEQSVRTYNTQRPHLLLKMQMQMQMHDAVHKASFASLDAG